MTTAAHSQDLPVRTEDTFVKQLHLCEADAASVTDLERVHDTWSKTGRCQQCSLALQNILQQMAKLSDQDPECVEVSTFIRVCVGSDALMCDRKASHAGKAFTRLVVDKTI